MKKRLLSKTLICILTLIVFLTVIPFATLADENETAEQSLLAEIDAMLAEPRVPGEIIFFMEDGITLDEAEEILGDIGVPNNFDDESVYIYRSDMETLYTSEELWFTIAIEETKIRNILYYLRTCPSVKSASPNMVYKPSDVLQQLSEIDSQVQAEANAPLEGYDYRTTSEVMEKMGVAEAWKAGFEGSSNIIIAVLDTGFTEHSDIEVINSGIYPTINKACVNTALARNTYVSDDDYINNAYSYDFADQHGHGTFIIGQIGAKLNDVGVNGICRGVTIVPIKISKSETVQVEEDGVIKEVVEDSSNSTSTARGVRYAKSIGADIINLSFEVGDDNAYDIISQQDFQGLFVVAAGNHDSEITTGSALANDAPNWIVVGNLWSNDQPSPTSNTSSLYVDIFAYGSLIQGCGILGNDIVEMSGTSMAAPHVAAAAALIMSHATHLTVSEVRQLLIDTATPIDDLNDLCVSGGRLNIIGAINDLYEASRPAYSKGDANGDGTIDTIDYMYVKRSILGTYTLNSSQTQGADANSDGSVNTLDYMAVRRFVLRTHYISPE